MGETGVRAQGHRRALERHTAANQKNEIPATAPGDLDLTQPWRPQQRRMLPLDQRRIMPAQMFAARSRRTDDGWRKSFDDARELPFALILLLRRRGRRRLGRLAARLASDDGLFRETLAPALHTVDGTSRMLRQRQLPITGQADQTDHAAKHRRTAKHLK